MNIVKPTTQLKPDLAILSFRTGADFRTWLHKNHASSPGIWLKMYKKDSGMESINYKAALDEALCYGWIDGQVKGVDEVCWIQKFVPRRPKGLWSKRNREHIERLTKEGKMQPAGSAQVEAAKADGRWEAAYDPPSNMVVPADFVKELAKYPKAEAFYKTLNRTNTYAIAFRLETAKKPETRRRWFNTLIEMMKKGQKFH